MVKLDNTFGKQLTKVRQATKGAFDNAYKITGKETDPELLAYSKLATEDFDALAESFGVEAVTDYIKNMESRKMRRP